MPAPLRIRESVIVDGTVTVGGESGVELTFTDGSLVTDGQVLSDHDALYAFKRDMESNGTDVPESAQDQGLPRWSLADAATQRVKWVWEIPSDWDEVDVRFGWAKNAAGSGDVVFRYSYQLLYPFASPNVDTGTMTDIAIPAVTVPGTANAFKYELPDEVSGITIADGAFDSKPFLLSSLQRLGSDANDTYAGSISVGLATLTRTG